MPGPATLFRTLLATQWAQLAPSIQRMHGQGALVRTRGQADVSAGDTLATRCLRRLLGLPAPRTGQPLEVVIERQGCREIWTRRFGQRQMRSVLELDELTGHLTEQLGPITLHFHLGRDADAIDGRLLGASILGIPLRRALLGELASRSGSRDERYAFELDARLPLLGQRVGYRGWREVADDH